MDASIEYVIHSVQAEYGTFAFDAEHSVEASNATNLHPPHIPEATAVRCSESFRLEYRLTVAGGGGAGSCGFESGAVIGEFREVKWVESNLYPVEDSRPAAPRCVQVHMAPSEPAETVHRVARKDTRSNHIGGGWNGSRDGQDGEIVI